jgi:hypothetical protein
VALKLRRLLSADQPTPYFLAALEMERVFEDLRSVRAASINTTFVEISRVYYGVSLTRRLCAWWGRPLSGDYARIST